MRRPHLIMIVVVAGLFLIAAATTAGPAAKAANDYGLGYQTVPSPTPKQSISPTSPPQATNAPRPQPQATSTPESSSTITPGATALSTPSALPTTGGNYDGGAALSLTVLALGILLLLGAFGLASARRRRP